ncbi:MAG: hypothetical protein O2819_01760 [Planctomycetota bacterium]|nr:hypothetical protein [Planctomycetota bacterium]MDA1105477.1 hypothetical protein [Planctomycetota bacterium]
MGQLALALRSLAFKIAVFVALATGLAWMVGGQLFPGWRSVHLDSVRSANCEWVMVVEGHASKPGAGRWSLERTLLSDDDSTTKIELLEGGCSFAVGPVMEEGRVVVLARSAEGASPAWYRVTLTEDGGIERTAVDAPSVLPGSTPTLP